MEPAGTQAGFMVWLTIPLGMTPEAVRDELETCISFGRPEVSLQYVLPPSPDGEHDAAVTG